MSSNDVMAGSNGLGRYSIGLASVRYRALLVRERTWAGQFMNLSTPDIEPPMRSLPLFTTSSGGLHNANDASCIRLFTTRTRSIWHSSLTWPLRRLAWNRRTRLNLRFEVRTGTVTSITFHRP